MVDRIHFGAIPSEVQLVLGLPHPINSLPHNRGEDCGVRCLQNPNTVKELQSLSLLRTLFPHSPIETFQFLQDHYLRSRPKATLDKYSCLAPVVRFLQEKGLNIANSLWGARKFLVFHSSISIYWKPKPWRQFYFYRNKATVLFQLPKPIQDHIEHLSRNVRGQIPINGYITINPYDASLQHSAQDLDSHTASCSFSLWLVALPQRFPQLRPGWEITTKMSWSSNQCLNFRLITSILKTAWIRQRSSGELLDSKRPWTSSKKLQNIAEKELHHHVDDCSWNPMAEAQCYPVHILQLCSNWHFTQHSLFY